ncbi:alpha/beta fold hydrolase [Streptomyces sp. NPDC008001]|uniref:alpha/beta fold hydrolase n=1 Tax=Streptomyces sp. NPDC008001 TaxID=3364804 RepID=UPI0036E8AD5F
MPPALLPGYPGPRHWHRVPATGQHYVDTGTGSPVLFLHGNPSWSYVWRHFFPVLSPHVRCLAPDLPGLGLSPRPPVPGSPLDRYTGQLDALDDLFAHLTTDRGLPGSGWTLVMHDWGGPLGVAWALRRPGVVTRLVVLNTIAFPWPPGYRLPFYLRWIRDHAPVAALVHLTGAFPHAVARLGVVRPIASAERRALLLPYARLRDRRAVVAYVRSIPRDAHDPAWTLLHAAGGQNGLADLEGLPVFLGWGLHDPVFTPLVLDAWRKRFPGARVHRYDAGHYVMEDAAGPLVHDLRAFLLETEGR